MKTVHSTVYQLHLAKAFFLLFLNATKIKLPCHV